MLHAVADVRAALRNLHGLLAPGGSLVFMDVATPQLWTEAVFGLTSGWWRFTDRDLRSVHPLLGRSQWEQLLQETGFAETASLPGLDRPVTAKARSGSSVVRVTKLPRHRIPLTKMPTEKSWLIFADEAGIGKSLAERLRTSGAHCRTVHRGTAYRVLATDTFTIRPEAPEDWRQLLQACTSEELERIVYLWNLDTELRL